MEDLISALEHFAYIFSHYYSKNEELYGAAKELEEACAAFIEALLSEEK